MAFARVPVRRKALAEQGAVQVVRTNGGMALGGSSTAPWDVDKATAEGYKRVTWIFRSIDVIASAQADRMIRWRTADRRRGQVLTTPDLDLILNSRSNMLEDSWAFRYRLSGQVLLSNRGAFIEVIRDKAGRVAALGLLPPQWTKPVPDPKTYISGFELRIPQQDPVTLKPENVIWVRKPDPMNPLGAVTPMGTLGLAAETDFLLRLYNRAFLANDGRPGGLVIIKGDMEETDKEELRARFSGNVNRAGRVSVITSDSGADWVDTATTPRDAQYKDLAALTQQEILLAFGVPKSQMGDASGRTYDNADAEDETFWEKTMFGHCGIMERSFDVLDDDPATLCSYDYSDVDVLVLAEQRRRKGLMEEVKARVRTVNEYREAIGLERVDGGDTLDSGGGGFEFLDLLAALERKALEPARLEVHTKDAADDTSMIPDAVVVDPFAWTSPTEKAQYLVKSVSDREQWEGVVAKTMKRYFQRQAKVVIEKLVGAKSVRQYSLHQKVDAEQVFDVKKWNKQLADDMLPILEAIHEDFGSIVAARAGTTFDVSATEAILSREVQMARMLNMNGTTFQLIETALATGTAAGEAMDALSERIAGIFESAVDYRSDLIARTEVLSASNQGLVLAARQSGVATTKTWVSADDDRVRDSHADADGQEVPLDEPFDLDGVELDAPGDPMGDPEEVLNCRCTMWFGTGPADDPDGDDLPTEDAPAEEDES